MNCAAARVYSCFHNQSGPAKAEDLDLIEAKYGVPLSAEVRDFYLRYGWGDGFAAAIVGSDGRTGPHYIRLDAPSEILEGWYENRPEGFIAIGSDGSGEMILVRPNGECGLLPFISNYATDYLRVSGSFEEFLQKAERGAWFEEIAPVKKMTVWLKLKALILGNS